MSLVSTTRFGDVEVSDDAVLHFPDGLIGLPGTDYALLPAGSGPFTWLQSMSEPALALPLTRPERFFPDFVLETGDPDAPAAEAEAAEIFVTVRAAAAPSECTANLRAPIVVTGAAAHGGRRAHQVINQAAGAEMRAPLFATA